MSLTKAFGDSNAAPKDTNMDANTGPDDSGYLGYKQMPFAKQMPAQSNADVTTSEDLALSAVNQGTSVKAYDEQDEIISSETGGGDTQQKSG